MSAPARIPHTWTMSTYSGTSASKPGRWVSRLTWVSSAVPALWWVSNSLTRWAEVSALLGAVALAVGLGLVLPLVMAVQADGLRRSEGKPAVQRAGA